MDEALKCILIVINLVASKTMSTSHNTFLLHAKLSIIQLFHESDGLISFLQHPRNMRTVAE